MPICHPEDATAGGGSSARWAWGRSCTSLPGGPSKGLSFRPSKTDRRLKSPTNVKGQPPGPRIRRESEVVATSGVLVNRREVVGSFDISATLELEVRSNYIPEDCDIGRARRLAATPWSKKISKFALRSENGVEVTGSPSELRWPLVCVGVVMGPSLPRFMILW